MRHKTFEHITKPEDCHLFSRIPPPQATEEGFDSNFPPESELEYFLQGSIPGLRDNSWVSQVRKAFKNSEGSTKVKIFKRNLNLFIF